jgi:hypothetical protein
MSTVSLSVSDVSFSSTYFLFLLLRLSFNVFSGLKRGSLITRHSAKKVLLAKPIYLYMNKELSDYKNFIPPGTSTEDGAHCK